MLINIYALYSIQMVPNVTDWQFSNIFLTFCATSSCLLTVCSVFTDLSLWDNPQEVYTLDQNSSNNSSINGSKIEMWSIFRSSSTVVSTKPRHNMPSASSSGPHSCLPAQLWLPLAVPPYFLVNAHHNALTLPAQSHNKYTKIHLKTCIFQSECGENSLNLPPSQHWAQLEAAEERISYLLESSFDCTSPTKLPTSTNSVFFPAIAAKKDTSMYVEYVGVIKLD